MLLFTKLLSRIYSLNCWDYLKTVVQTKRPETSDLLYCSGINNGKMIYDFSSEKIQT